LLCNSKLDWCILRALVRLSAGRFRFQLAAFRSVSTFGTFIYGSNFCALAAAGGGNFLTSGHSTELHG
jgi:hypothetical protein